VIIINVKGVLRLIDKARKPEAQHIKERILEIEADILSKGINWASLPKTWPYRGEELTWGEFVAKKEEAYFRRHPDATFDEFVLSLPDR
jgi:hypothetical protein